MLELNEGIEILILVFLIFYIGVLILKTYLIRNIKLISLLIPNIYLAGAIIWDILFDIDHAFVLVGMALVTVGSLVYTILSLFSRKFRVELLTSDLISSLSNLKEKYSFVLETAQVPIYTIGETGRFEYANTAMAKLLEVQKPDDLLKKPIFDFYPEKIREEIKSKILSRLKVIGEEADYTTEILTAKGNIIKVHIIAKTTVNGHVTITGSMVKIA